MSSEDNKALVRRFFEEVLNEKRVDRAGRARRAGLPGPCCRARASARVGRSEAALGDVLCRHPRSAHDD
jgi:hypothetical protein